MTPDAIRPVIARWFPDQDIAIERAGSGTSTPVFAVRVAGDTFFARLAEDPGERRDAEVAVHRLLTASGVPVPRIVRYEPDPPDLDRSLALTTRVPGVALADASTGPWLPDVACAAGDALSRVNALPVRGYGWVSGIDDDGALLAAHPTRAAWAAEYLAAAETVAASGILASGIAADTASAVARWAVLPDPAISRLAHGDLDATHLYVDPASAEKPFTGIIDFGEIRGADPLYDLGHLLLHDGEGGRPVLLPSLLAGYTQGTPLPGDTMHAIRLHALAIGARALAIQSGRPHTPYRAWLAHRLTELTSAEG